MKEEIKKKDIGSSEWDSRGPLGRSRDQRDLFERFPLNRDKVDLENSAFGI